MDNVFIEYDLYGLRPVLCDVKYVTLHKSYIHKNVRHPYTNAYLSTDSVSTQDLQSLFFLDEIKKIDIKIIRDEEDIIIPLKYGINRWCMIQYNKDFNKLIEAYLKFKYNGIPHETERKDLAQKLESGTSDSILKILKKISSCENFRTQHHFLNFFGISHLSFINDFGNKLREGLLTKQSESNCGTNERFFVLRDTWLCYLDPSTREIRGVLLFDRGVSVEQRKSKITVKNLTRALHLDCATENRAVAWYKSMHDILRYNPITIGFLNPNNRFESFAPIRRGSHANWFIDGKDYMKNVAYALEHATEEIFITGFHVTPEYFLRRPFDMDETARLDLILLKKAIQGVKVYILIFREIKRFLGNGSQHCLDSFKNLHPNIKILRHPDQLKTPEAALWSHHEKLVIIDQSVAYFGGIDLCYGRWDTRHHLIYDFDHYDENPPETKRSVSNYFDAGGMLWLGKDYFNPLLSDLVSKDVEEPFVDKLDRRDTPRMPWHDVGGVVCGETARDIARHFILRWNHVKLKKRRNNTDYPLLLPKSYYSFKIPRKIIKNCYECETQVVRSLGTWSGGIREKEASIYTAMLAVIENAEHYIYIENQYFISVMNSASTENRIAHAIFDRIVKAHRRAQNFKVYIMMPLVPGYEGMYTQQGSSNEEIITSFNNESIITLFKNLIKADITPKDYIGIFSLRNWACFGKRVNTEQIYVHSKLTIVDDKICILGSANINDRSLDGARDSELAVVIEDKPLYFATLNGQKRPVGKFCRKLRKTLFKEFLAMDKKKEEELKDICNNEVFEYIKAEAAYNTQIYTEYFNAIPDNNITTRESLRFNGVLPKYSNEQKREAALQLHGLIVEYQPFFLNSVNLLPRRVKHDKFIHHKIFT